MDLIQRGGRRGPVVRLLCLAALMFLLGAGAALADGVYVPEKAYKKLPGIPSQSAFISYRGGVEELIIESALDGEGQSFGWIIPVPAKPTELEEVTPGFLKTLAVVLQPEITHDIGGRPKTAAAVVAFVALWAIAVLVHRPTRSDAIMTLALMVAVAMVAAMLMPALARAGRSIVPSARVKIEDACVVGNYDVTVLQAQDATALSHWLEQNGFAALPEAGAGIVEDYIADGWHFIAAKLRREGSGPARPHPMSITFPAERPVYPMRLTALAGSEVYLELFVAAQQGVEDAGGNLSLDFCDTCSLGDYRSRWLSRDKTDRGFETPAFHRWVGHPEAQDRLWNGCVLSRLSGSLKPEDMSADIYLDPGESEPFRRHYYSRQGARDTGLCIAATIWVALVIVVLSVGCPPTKEERKEGFFWGGVVRLLFISVACLAAWGAFCLFAPKTEVTSTRSRRWNTDDMAMVAGVYARDSDNFAGMALPEVGASLLRRFESDFKTNGVTGGRIKAEDSPGNFVVLADDRGLVIRVFDEYGFPLESVLREQEPEPGPADGAAEQDSP